MVSYRSIYKVSINEFHKPPTMLIDFEIVAMFLRNGFGKARLNALKEIQESLPECMPDTMIIPLVEQIVGIKDRHHGKERKLALKRLLLGTKFKKLIWYVR